MGGEYAKWDSNRCLHFQKECVGEVVGWAEHEVRLEGDSVSELVACCFCGKQLPERSAVLMVIYPTAERDELHSLYAVVLQ